MIHRLKEIRKALGLNQTDFAKYLGITQTAYSMIESGNRPLADKYVKVICSSCAICHADQYYLRLVKSKTLQSAHDLRDGLKRNPLELLIKSLN